MKGGKMKPEDRAILESIARETGAQQPEQMTDSELISFICDK